MKQEYEVGDKVKFKSDVTGELIDAEVIEKILEDGVYLYRVITQYGIPRMYFKKFVK